MDAEVAGLRGALEGERKRLDRLVMWHLELREESEALRDCLQASGAVGVETFLARVHRRRFARVLRTHPCSWEGSLEASLGLPDLVLVVAGLTDQSGAASLALCSRGICRQVQVVSQELATMFPPQVYAIGGFDDVGVLSTVECFDAVESRWSPVAPLNVPRWDSAVATLCGRIVVAGGRGMDNEVLASTEAFDPRRGRWEIAPGLLTARAEAVAASVQGRLLVIGGQGGQSAGSLLSSVECLEAGAEDWRPLPSIRLARSNAASAAVGSRVYLLGGRVAAAPAQGKPITREVEWVCGALETARWVPAPPLLQARASHSAATVHGCIYAVGGTSGGRSSDLASVERYSPSTETWESLVPMELPQRELCAVACGGLLLVFGGVMEGESSSLSDYADVGAVSQYDPRSGEWKWLELSAFPRPQRYFAASACRLVDGERQTGCMEVQCVIPELADMKGVASSVEPGRVM